MKIIAPQPVDNKNKIITRGQQALIRKHSLKDTPVFKGGTAIASLISDKERGLFNVFAQHYGNAGDRVGKKLANLVNNSKILEANSRFDLKEGVSSIKDKSMLKSLGENIVFPVVQLPLYAASWVVKQIKRIPCFEDKAEKVYRSSILRIPRKLKELDEKTDILQGMYKKTSEIVKKYAGGIKTEDIKQACDQETLELLNKFIKDKNADGIKGIKSDVLVKMLNNPDKYPKFKETIKKANEFIKENLYKASNKFFDKHTGNYNTAFERPLCRIVSGIIPAIFLANDAYNLAILCGDTKEMSKKEAKDRKRQEIMRVCVTAYMQLLMFGAFTKQVNNLPWFVPVASAATVLASEIISRLKLGKPIFFLSKEKAQVYNKKKQNKTNKTNKAVAQKNNYQPTFNQIQKDTPKIFTSFKAVTHDESTKPIKKTEEKDKKSEPKKALMNMKTLSKLILIALAGGFVLSFLKNSSLTKDSKIIKKIKDFGSNIKKNVYDKIAYKDFEISEKDFKSITQSLKDADCREIAEGHEFIKDKYGKVKDGIIKMYKSTISDSGSKKTAESIITALKGQETLYSEKELETIEQAIKTAISQNKTNIAENKFIQTAQKAIEIIKNKKINVNEEKLTELISNEIKNNVKSSPVRIETATKPLADIVTEPFKFLMSFIKFPFKVTSTLIKLMVGPIEKKAAQELLGKAELTKYERAIHKAVTELFGTPKEKSGKISQEIFANAIEQLDKNTKAFRNAQKAYQAAAASGCNVENAKKLYEKAKNKLLIYVNSAVEKSFNGVTQSSNKNTDLAMMAKLASSAVTSAFLVADNYNMVMIKSNGEDKEGAKEKANERIIQRLSALFYQSMLINWFNATFRSTYNHSLKGMTAVVIPNSLTTEILTRKSIGMPLGRKTYEELQEIDEKNNNRKGFLGAYFRFMRLLTGKKPLKDRLPKTQVQTENTTKNNTSLLPTQETNLIKLFLKQ